MPRLVIVGAGVFGASLAHRAAGEGWETALVEQHEPGHIRAASGGESRLYRCGHGDETLYTRMARRALPMWRELEAEAGEALLIECGLLWLARRVGGWETETERRLREEGIPVERVDPAEYFPQVYTEDLAFGLLEPEAGALRAADATRALARCAQARGARLIHGRAEPDGDRVRLNDETLEADIVVWACGAWMPDLFGDLLPVRVSRQDIVFFGPPQAGWSPPRMPCWIDYEGPYYGSGDIDGWGLKLVSDWEGPPFHPDGERVAPLPEVAEGARAYLRHRFPAIGTAPMIQAKTCQYPSTPDTHFIAAPHPEHSTVWLLGGDSGHGFKHGPAFAQTVLEMLSGSKPAEPLWGLGQRVAGTGLRTAGIRYEEAI
jgi:glycine/D-amino acid oxidase-like deaminating enzyme